MTLRMTGMFLAAIWVASAATQAGAAEPLGTWLSQSGETKVRVAPCGSSLCGTVVWVRSGGTASKNPDKAKQGRLLVDVRMIYDVQPSGSGYAGKLCDYKDGNTYTGRLVMMDGNRPKLSGCRLKVFCRSQIWTRAN